MIYLLIPHDQFLSGPPIDDLQAGIIFWGCDIVQLTQYYLYPDAQRKKTLSVQNDLNPARIKLGKLLNTRKTRALYIHGILFSFSLLIGVTLELKSFEP